MLDNYDDETHSTDNNNKYNLGTKSTEKAKRQQTK